MERLFGLKYPKISMLLFSIVFSYFYFSTFSAETLTAPLGSLSHFGVFLMGALFAFGFTAPIATGFFITLNPSNPIMTGIIAGFGALVSDLIIFNFIRISFMNDFKKFGKDFKKDKIYNTVTQNYIFRKLKETNNWHGMKRIKTYILYSFAGIAIASPLPDELGIIMIAGLTKIKQKTLAIIGFVLNTIGIIIILHL